MEIRHERSLIFCKKNGIISTRVIDMKEFSIYVNGKFVFKGYNVFKKYFELCDLYGEENVEIK